MNPPEVSEVPVVPFESDNRTEPATVDIYAELKSPGTQMAMALTRVKRDGQCYEGTVPRHVKDARRAKNKRSRAGRRAQRLAQKARAK